MTTDLELIKCTQKGDTASFDVLVRRWERPIYNFILRYIGNREDAQDLCQKTFIRAFESLQRLRDPQKFSSWLYQIALNTCRDRSRRKPQFVVSLDSGIGPPENLVTPPSDLPDALTHERHVRDILNKALQSIPEEQRAVLIMKEYQGLKFREIAETLDVSINTVKSRMYYGLNALRKIFDQWDLDREKMTYEL